MTVTQAALSPGAQRRLLQQLEDAEADARRMRVRFEKADEARRRAQAERDGALKFAAEADADATAAWKRVEELGGLEEKTG